MKTGRTTAVDSRGSSPQQGSHGRSAVVLCNGEAPSRRLVARAIRETDLFVCADGGANSARTYGLMPDLVIGDLDSARPGTLRWCSRARIIRIRRQDNTDLEKTLDHLLVEGVREVVILGAAGGRLDMTLANLSVLWMYAGRMRITCAGDGWRAVPVVRSLVLTTVPDTTVSLMPFGPCSGITLRGLKYPLRNARMPVGRIGVSNVAVHPEVSVTVRRGRMLVLVGDHVPPVHR